MDLGVVSKKHPEQLGKNRPEVRQGIPAPPAIPSNAQDRAVSAGLCCKTAASLQESCCRLHTVAS